MRSAWVIWDPSHKTKQWTEVESAHSAFCPLTPDVCYSKGLKSRQFWIAVRLFFLTGSMNTHPLHTPIIHLQFHDSYSKKYFHMLSVAMLEWNHSILVICTFFFLTIFICLLVGGGRNACLRQYKCVDRRKTFKSWFPPSSMLGTRDRIPVLRFGNKCLYPLSHLTKKS